MPLSVRLAILTTCAFLFSFLSAAAQSPGPPTSLTVTVNEGRTLTLQWTAPATGGPATGYIVQVGGAPGSSTLINEQIGNITTYTTEVNFAPGSTVYARVRALNGAGISVPSAEVVVTITCTAPAGQPFALTWRMLTATDVQITWVPPSPSPYTEYSVEVGSATGLSDVAVVSSGNVRPTFVTIALGSAGTFFARVRGMGGCSSIPGPASEEIRIQSGAVSGPSTSIVVNEFGGFVELKNISAAPITISGWRIQTTTGFNQVGVLAASTRGGVVIGPGCTYLMVPTGDSVLVPADEPLSAGAHDGVAIVRPDGLIIDSAGRRNSSAQGPDTPFIEGNNPLGARSDGPSVASHARVADADTDQTSADFIPLTTATPQNLSGCGISPPDPPAGLRVSTVGSALNLSWTSPSSGSARSGFVVQIGKTSGASDVLNQRIDNVRSFQTATLPGGTYFVRVRALNGAGISTPSNEVTAAVGLSPTLPGPPRNLSASVSGNTVSLSWSAPATGGTALQYRLLAGTAPGSANAGEFSLASSLNAVAFPNVPNGIYYARLRAVNAAGTSEASNEVTIVVCSAGCPSSPPGAVTQLVFQVSGNNVLLTWTAPGSGDTPSGYVVEAGTATGLSNLGQFPTGSAGQFVIVSGVPPGTYFVRVRAAAGGVLGPVSNEVVIVVP
jgi:predicted phage tail protein